MIHALDNPLLVLLAVNEGPKRLVEIKDPDVHVIRELILVEQLDALCLAVDVFQALLDLAVEGSLAEGTDISERVFFDTFKQS